jgi:hypothetical protein
VLIATPAALLVSVSVLANIEILKEVPKSGELRYRQVVYVDDGTCPKGEVKEITGGNRDQSIPRKVRCVKRPASAGK